MSSTSGAVFTVPCQPAGRNGVDNARGDLIVSLNYIIEDPKGTRYTVVGMLGSGQFGQVFQVAEISPSGELGTAYAMKITKSELRYRAQAEHEVQMLSTVLENAFENEASHVSKLVNWFVFKGHVCIVLELLSVDLLAIIKKRDYVGLPLALVQNVARELLAVLVCLKRSDVVHGDIKPENVVLSDGFSAHVKLIDFGSARLLRERCSFYIQSRYYRAPEVVLAIPHGCEIDMWSLGCLLVELFIGMPIFAGQSEVQLLEIITSMMGQFPAKVIRKSPRAAELFHANGVMKTELEVCAEKGTMPAARYDYLEKDNIPDLIMTYEVGLGRTPEDRQKQIERRQLFVDFVMRTLALAQEDRIRPEEALEHPFITTDFS